MTDRASRHPHRHDGQGRTLPDPASYVRADPAARLREHPAVLLADPRQQGHPAARATSCARRSATPTSRSARSACSAIRSGTRSSTARRCSGWETLIDNAHLFGADLIAGFTGRVRGKPLPDSLPRFKEVWGELARRAADKGVRIAFENCAMDGNWATGDWNIAHNPDAWELMFNALPDDNLGLEWEPCHQLVYLIDPIPQIRKWAPEILPRARQGRDGALGRDPRARHLRQAAVRADAHAGLRRQRLDARHQRAAARRLHRHRSTSKAGMTRSIATPSK